MGNRAVITTEKKDLAVYLHWNGGRDSVEPFLAYCKMRGFRAPESDCYGWARLCQVIANYFGAEGLSIGIDTYRRLKEAGDDNGVYIIQDWQVVDRIYPYNGYEEQDQYDFDEMIFDIDAAQPKDQQLGDYLKAEEVPVAEIEIGDMVYMMTCGGRPEAFEVVGIGKPEIVNGVDVGGVPYVKRYGHDGDYSWNCNNYLRGKTVRRVCP